MKKERLKMIRVLYNPLANNKNGKAEAEKLKETYGDGISFEDVTKISDISAYIAASGDDTIVLAGGDGTINRFACDVYGKLPEKKILYYPAGSGNDFYNDVKDSAERENGLVILNPYITDLPTVTVNGITQPFVNGIGYGIDGYCCEEGDKHRERSDKPVNYTSIAIKGLLFHFKPVNAKVTVDGKTYEFKKVYLAPSMNGRFYGGGMMIAPAQDRLNGEHSLSVVLYYGASKLKTLMVFPSIFKGEHVKHTEMVEVITGHDITVEFDRPTALQIDGETIVGVTSYTVHSAK